MQRRILITLLSCLTIPSVVSAQAAGAKCAPDNAGLKLPAGLCASIFADTVRGARHLVVAPNGDVFVSAQGRGGGVIALRPNAGGQADAPKPFATGFTSSEVALFDGYLYTEALACTGARSHGRTGHSLGDRDCPLSTQARRADTERPAGHDRRRLAGPTGSQHPQLRDQSRGCVIRQRWLAHKFVSGG
jgi:hypothetical protein